MIGILHHCLTTGTNYNRHPSVLARPRPRVVFPAQVNDILADADVQPAGS